MLVKDCKKFDGEKFGRNNDDAGFELLEAAAAEKYADRSSDGRNCCEKACRRKSASNADNVDIADVTNSDY